MTRSVVRARACDTLAPVGVQRAPHSAQRVTLTRVVLMPRAMRGACTAHLAAEEPHATVRHAHASDASVDAGGGASAQWE